MLVSTVIQDIRNRINDKEAIGDFDNDDIVSYINQAINYIGLYFVTAQNPLAISRRRFGARRLYQILRHFAH